MLKIFPEILKGLLESTIISKEAVTEWAEDLEEDDEPGSEGMSQVEEATYVFSYFGAM